MTKKKTKPTDSSKTIFLALGLLAAFLPALLRVVGVEIVPTGSSRGGEIITLLCVLGGASVVAWSVQGWASNKYPSQALGLSALAGIAVAVLAWLTNVFSMFAPY